MVVVHRVCVQAAGKTPATHAELLEAVSEQVVHGVWEEGVRKPWSPKVAAPKMKAACLTSKRAKRARVRPGVHDFRPVGKTGQSCQWCSHLNNPSKTGQKKRALVCREDCRPKLNLYFDCSRT